MVFALPRPSRKPWRAAVCAAALLSGVTAAAELRLNATRTGARIDVTVGGDFFTSYRFAADEKYPFFFPVNGPSGASVTSMRNGRYPHHSSLFFGCDRVNDGNYWQDGLEAGQIVSEGAVIVRGSGPQVVIADTCVWRKPGADPVIRDTRRFTLSAPDATRRGIDVEIALEPLVDIAIAKTNHSLFSVRLDPDLAPANGGVLVNADGLEGEQATFGRRAPWLAAYGHRGGGMIEGLAVLQHPANRWGVAPWFTRDYGFLSPTPMFWPDDGRATRLARGEIARLRYRVIVFAGEPARDALPRAYAEFAGLPLSTP